MPFTRLMCAGCLGAVVACGGNNTTPTPVTPAVPACQANNTSNVSFGNRSASTTQDIVWDGLKLGTLAPGQSGLQLTASAGVAHRLEFRITNTTNGQACATSNPIPIQCATPIYTCMYP